MYKPLPDCLTIKKSPIEGLGLYASKKIRANSFIGLTHVRDKNFENGYIRTPLGGFIIILMNQMSVELLLMYFLN